MVIVKVIRHSDGGLNYLWSMNRYIRDGREIASGGYGVELYDYRVACHQMEMVRQCYNQMSTNPLIHFVVSFDRETDNVEYAKAAAPQIAAYFNGNYQYLWCVHPADEDSSHYHVHILLHSVNMLNGRLFHSGPYEINGFCYHVKQITGMPYKLDYYHE